MITPRVTLPPNDHSKASHGRHAACTAARVAPAGDGTGVCAAGLARRVEKLPRCSATSRGYARSAAALPPWTRHSAPRCVGGKRRARSSSYRFAPGSELSRKTTTATRATSAASSTRSAAPRSFRSALGLSLPAPVPRPWFTPTAATRDDVKGDRQVAAPAGRATASTLDDGPRRGSVEGRGVGEGWRRSHWRWGVGVVAAALFLAAPLLTSLTSPAREGASDSEHLDRAMASDGARASQERQAPADDASPGAVPRENLATAPDATSSGQIGLAPAGERRAQAHHQGLTRGRRRRRRPRRRPTVLSPAATRSTAGRVGDVAAAGRLQERR